MTARPWARVELSAHSETSSCSKRAGSWNQHHSMVLGLREYSEQTLRPTPEKPRCLLEDGAAEPSRRRLARHASNRTASHSSGHRRPGHSHSQSARGRGPAGPMQHTSAAKRLIEQRIRDVAHLEVPTSYVKLAPLGSSAGRGALRSAAGFFQHLSLSRRNGRLSKPRRFRTQQRCPPLAIGLRRGP